MSLLERSLNKIKVLLVDDEIEACENLREFINEYFDNIQIVGIVHNTKEAEKYIAQYKPDALFLDIQMPNENAFNFLERIKPFEFEIIFVTAFDQYAITALRLNAIDYILKPISTTELIEAIIKLTNRINSKEKLLHNDRFTEVSKQLSGKSSFENIVLKSQNHIEIVELKSILYIEAQSNYSKFFYLTKNNTTKNTIISHSIAMYEELLSEMQFYRVHRSYLVNLKQIEKINASQQLIILKNGIQLPISRRKYNDFINSLTESQSAIKKE